MVPTALMRRLRRILWGLVPLAAIAGAAAWWLAPERTVRIIEDATAVSVGGPFTMVDHRGRTVSERTLLGSHALIYFGYTACPDVCPTELGTMAAAIDALPAAVGARVRPVFVTVDPERDTVAVLSDYVAAFHPRMLGLTGTPEQVDVIKRRYHVYSRALDKEEDGFYFVDHSTVLILMGPDGRFVELLRPQLSVDEMAARLRARLS